MREKPRVYSRFRSSFTSREPHMVPCRPRHPTCPHTSPRSAASQPHDVPPRGEGSASTHLGAACHPSCLDGTEHMRATHTGDAGRGRLGQELHAGSSAHRTLGCRAGVLVHMHPHSSHVDGARFTFGKCKILVPETSAEPLTTLTQPVVEERFWRLDWFSLAGEGLAWRPAGTHCPGQLLTCPGGGT